MTHTATPGQRPSRAASRCAAAALLALPPAVVAQFGQAWVRILDFALLYVMLALGLNIVVGFAGLLDLGYVAFYAVGAYTFALLASPHLSSLAIAAVPDWCTAAGRCAVAAALAAIGILLGVPDAASCAVTTWPSSPWASARSSGSS